MAGALFLVTFAVVGDARSWPQSIAEADPELSVAATLLLLPLTLLWTIRSARLLHAYGYATGLSLWWLVVTTNSLNALLPAASGELVRLRMLRTHFGVPTGVSLPLIAFETLLGFTLVAVVIPVALISITISVAAGLAAFTLLSAALMAIAAAASGLVERAPRSELAERVLSLVAAALEPWTRPSLFLGFTLWSVPVLAVGAGQFHLAALAAGLTPSFEQSALVWATSIVAGTVSAIPFGVGAAELSAIIVGQALFGEPEAWAAAYILYRIVGSLPLALVAVVAGVGQTLRRPPSEGDGH